MKYNGKYRAACIYLDLDDFFFAIIILGKEKQFVTGGAEHLGICMGKMNFDI